MNKIYEVNKKRILYNEYIFLDDQEKSIEKYLSQNKVRFSFVGRCYSENVKYTPVIIRVCILYDNRFKKKIETAVNNLLLTGNPDYLNFTNAFFCNKLMFPNTLI